MTLRTVAGQQTAESAADLEQWLRNLQGCPPVTRTLVARCTQPVHGDDPAMWFYVEADSVEGVARLRCLACAHMRPVLDSSERWTYPQAWACTNCRQSLAEVAFGVHEDNGLATWMAVAARCVGCGHVDGLTDLVVPGIAGDVFAATL